MVLSTIHQQRSRARLTTLLTKQCASGRDLSCKVGGLLWSPGRYELRKSQRISNAGSTDLSIQDTRGGAGRCLLSDVYRWWWWIATTGRFPNDRRVRAGVLIPNTRVNLASTDSTLFNHIAISFAIVVPFHCLKSRFNTSTRTNGSD